MLNVYRHVLCVTINWVWIGFIYTLYTPRRTTRNYSAIADLHALHFTVTHAH
jgi:hypothetical protein